MSLATELATLDTHVAPALEAVRVPAVLVNAEGRIRWLNASAIDLFGDKRGQRYTDAIAPADTGVAREQFARKILGGPSTDFRVGITGAKGETIPVEVSSVGLRNGVRVVGVFGLLKPIDRESRARPLRAPDLTPRQYEVLRHLGDGCSTRDIAREMGISEETVRNHVRGVFKVLRVHSRLEAVAIAHTEGLLD